jgi:hypothetical protein
MELEEPGYNQGFGAGHNLVFARYASDLFVMVNSDVRMESSDWLLTIIALFSERPLALAGLISTAAKLRSDGCGIEVADPARDDFDFVDGSLLAINSKAGRRLGLFAESYRFFYFEDADLCLRFRQAGFAPALLDLPYHHDRSASARLFPRPLIQGMLDHNRARFFAAWSPYLERGTLSRRIAVQFQPQDYPQQCASLPALFGLTRDHPAAMIELVGVHPLLRLLFQHPRWEVSPGVSLDKATDYYHIFSLNRAAESAVPLAYSLCRSLQTEGDFAAARSHLESLCTPLHESAASRIPVVVVPRDTPLFQGLRPSLESFTRIISTLQSHSPVSLYTELPRYQWPKGWTDPTLIEPAMLPRLLANLRICSWLVTTDHWVLQLAQLLDVPSFAWFGASDPKQRIWNWSFCGIFTVAGLPCLGCNQALGTLHENICVRADIACMGGSAVAFFLQQLADFNAQRIPPPWLQAAWTNSIFASSRLPSSTLDLSRWRTTAAERVLVLIPVKPGLPTETLKRCRALAERATAAIAHSRVVLDEGGVAPARGSHASRQTALAKIRQDMVERHLRDEHWIFWVDADIVDYPDDLIVSLIQRAEGGIAAPLILMEGATDELPANSEGFGPGRFFDVAGFVENGRWAAFTPPYFQQVGPVYDLESVGSCYLVNADIYRQGARHEADSLSLGFASSGKAWPANAVSLSQKSGAIAYTEHFSVCAFARAQGLPVRAFADLIAYHERVA